MKRAVIIAVCVAVMSGSALEARAGEWFGGLAWHNSIGVANSNEFTPGYSLRGIGGDLRYLVDPYVSLGLSAAWNVLASRATDDFRVSNIDVQGRQRRAFNAVPMMVNGHVYTPGSIRLMMGFGVGASWIERRIDIGLFDVADANVHFTFAPEVGFAIKGFQKTWILVSSRYHYAAPSGEAPEQQWFSFAFGLGSRVAFD